MSDTTNNKDGVNLCDLLTVLFVGLKLTGNIDWSWWWVLAPLWAPIVILGITSFAFALWAKE